MIRLPPSAPQPFPRGRSYAWMGFLSLAFVVYGSLAPFSFRALSAREAREEFQKVLSRPLHFGSRSDAVANVLLMLPAGFFLMGALGVDRPRWLAPGDALLVLPLCVAVSFAVEFAQLFLSNRTSALEDILAQTAGAVVGMLLWCAAGQKLTRMARRLWAPSLPVRLDARLLPAYLLVLALVHLVPLDLITSPADLYHKFKGGLINLIPFRYSPAVVFAYAEGRLVETLYFFLLGLMLPGLPWPFWRDRRQVGRVLGWSLVLVGCVTGLKLLAASRGFDVTDVLLGTLACLIGWAVSLAVRQTASEGARWAIVRAALWAGLGLWLALVTFVTWQPFDWDLELGEARLRALPLVPFVDVLRGDPLNAFGSLAQKLVLYLPLGVLVTSWSPAPVRLAWLPALACSVVVAGTLEAGQLFLASRTAALTDVYVQVAGAVLGSVITRRVCMAPTEEPDGLEQLRSTLARQTMAW